MQRTLYRLSGPALLAAGLLLSGAVAVAAADATPDAAPIVTATVSGQTAAAEAPFIAENTAAMDKMMAGMEVKPTGDIDADFAAMMIPHHQGAIDMAIAELRYGKNEQLRRISQEIIVDQQQEIAAMRLALGQPLPPSTAAPTEVPSTSGASPHVHMHATDGTSPMSPTMNMK